jgi:SsrA-binding protein
MRKKASPVTSESRRADRVVTSNRRASHEYFIDETVEAGIVLQGTEIKSIREGKISISEAYARLDGGELWLVGANISPYTHGSHANHDPDRRRKLLVHRSQIRQLRAELEQKGRTLIPLRVRLSNGKAKIDIGVARGKKLHDKRQSESERESRREIERVLHERR